MDINEVDEDIRSLVRAMNKFPGIHTTGSCSGHGEHPIRVFFQIESKDDLPGLLYWFDACHSGVKGWKVIARTDCAMSPVHFLAESSEKGKPAYEQADQIAQYMNEWHNEPASIDTN